jgi:hypothetical protein
MFRLQLEDLEPQEEVVNVPPEEVVAEKQTLLSKLHSFERKDEKPEEAVIPTVEKKSSPTIEPLKVEVPKKIEVSG